MQRITRAAAVLGITRPKYYGGPARYILALLIAISTALLPAGESLATGSLTNVSASLDNPLTSASANYTFTGSSVDGASNAECVQLVWSTTASGNTAPTGFSGAAGSVNAAASTLINSSASGWSLAKSDGTSSTGQNNIYQYTNSTGVVPSTTTDATFVTSGITNSSAANTAYYLNLTTYSSTNCTTGLINSATAVYINTNGSTLSLTVNPTLSFSINSVSATTSCDGTTTTAASTPTTIPFGIVNSASNAIVCQDLQAATNASSGYTIFLRYTSQPTSGSNTIADAPGNNTSPAAFPSAGVEAYGYTTSDATLSTTYGAANRFTSPIQGWAAGSTSNSEIAYQPAGSSATDYYIAHQVGVSPTTLSGNYDTTIIYTCTPVY